MNKLVSTFSIVIFLSSFTIFCQNDFTEKKVVDIKNDDQEINLFMYFSSDGQCHIVEKDEYEDLKEMGLYQNIIRGFSIGVSLPAIAVCLATYREKKINLSYWTAAMPPALYYDLNDCSFSYIIARTAGFFIGVGVTSFFLKERLKSLIDY